MSRERFTFGFNDQYDLASPELTFPLPEQDFFSQDHFSVQEEKFKEADSALVEAESELGLLLPDEALFSKNQDQISLREGKPEDAYKALFEADKNKFYQAKRENVLKRVKLQNRLERSPLNVQIYSALSALNHLSKDCRVVVNTDGEMLLAKEGPAGWDRPPHYAMAKLKLDNKGEIPPDYHVVNNDKALFAGMAIIKGGKYDGLSHHSGGFRLKFGAMLSGLIIVLQLPIKYLADPFTLTEVDSEGKAMVSYRCPLKDLKKCVFAKYTAEERAKMASLNKKKVVISLQRGESPVPASASDSFGDLLHVMSEPLPAKKNKLISNSPKKSGFLHSSAEETFFGRATPPKKRLKVSKLKSSESEQAIDSVINQVSGLFKTPPKAQRQYESGAQKKALFSID